MDFLVIGTYHTWRKIDDRVPIAMLISKLPDMRARERNLTYWLLGNALGMGAFLYIAAQSWVEPGTEPLGEAFIWGATALPILIFVFFLHLFVGKAALVARNRTRCVATALTGLSWMATVAFDNAHHGI